MTDKMQTEWQTIDSAPRDGTRILCSRVGKRDSYKKSIRSTHWGLAPDKTRGERVEKWINFINGDPTHWMPLPKPPEEV